MGQREVNRALRRIKGATSRVENEPRDYVPTRRLPRVTTSPIGHAWCQLSGPLGPATGTWPSVSATTIGGQTLYRESGGSLVALQGTYTLYNWRNVPWATGKTTLVLPNGDGTWDIDDQDC